MLNKEMSRHQYMLCMVLSFMRVHNTLYCCCVHNPSIPKREQKQIHVHTVSIFMSFAGHKHVCLRMIILTHI